MTDAEYDYSDGLATEIVEAFSSLSMEDVLPDTDGMEAALEAEYARMLGY